MDSLYGRWEFSVSFYLSLLALSIHLTQRPRRTFKSASFLSAVPIAIAVNIVRLIGTAILVRHSGPVVAEGFIHDFSGWLLFVFGLMALILLQSLFTNGTVVKRI